MDWKKILKRGLIIALACCIIACIGGIATLDLPFIIIVGLLVLILAGIMVLIHNQRGDKDE